MQRAAVRSLGLIQRMILEAHQTLKLNFRARSLQFEPTSAECVCCTEFSAVVAKIGELGDTSVVCIKLHPGFPITCRRRTQ